MTDFAQSRIALSTGVELDVVDQGPRDAPAIILLHGFPESHRTWRHQIAGLADRFRVIAPDQRGYARSSKPAAVEDYVADKLVADIVALADALGVDRFTLVGHDWGGAIAWIAALMHPGRIERLVIVNAPHPYVFQKTLIDDATQRAASQYITAFRNPGFENVIDSMGLDRFFDTTFAKHADLEKLAPEKPYYLESWGQPGAMTAMLNWYRASNIIVPAPDAEAERPAMLSAPFPPVTVPTLVLWGMKDQALLPSQLDGLDALVADLRIKTTDAGHFVPWEAPDFITAAIGDFAAG